MQDNHATQVDVQTEPEVTDSDKFHFWLRRMDKLIGDSQNRLDQYRKTANAREDKIEEMQNFIEELKQCQTAYGLMLIDWELAQEKISKKN